MSGGSNLLATIQRLLNNPSILLFYLSFWCLLTLFFRKKWKLPISVLISMLIVLVASEYWELPIFIYGLLGVAYWWPYPSIFFLLHHIYITIIFVMLMYVMKIKLSKPIISILLYGIVLNAALLHPLLVSRTIGFVARTIGIIILSCVVYHGSSLVGLES